MEIKLGLSLPRDEISIPIVRRICAQALTVLGVSPDCTADVELALTEACANVLAHATADDDYEVRVGVDNGLAVIEVVDHGGGFDVAKALEGGGAASPNGDGPAGSDGDGDGSVGDGDGPTEHLSEGGRGILLMRALMDRVRFDAVEGPHQGTRVHLEKVLTWNDRSPGAQLIRARAGGDP
ncbi:ATP-binding protein [Parafrankia sp. EUN1f]|uniref:ATP-binding protein n=1 Tax=Parafrankia sp. EUN1f TaxID=102897 RepID=UPI0001C43B0B|nr:ATP-binding protein [Parafrankia sp. EUN1f]EFC82100.1 putative anti-sigma regulatory factor, serine/threonine protein kinase [Parafrankia sp. EUN1f]